MPLEPAYDWRLYLGRPAPLSNGPPIDTPPKLYGRELFGMQGQQSCPCSSVPISLSNYCSGVLARNNADCCSKYDQGPCRVARVHVSKALQGGRDCRPIPQVRGCLW